MGRSRPAPPPAGARAYEGDDGIAPRGGARREDALARLETFAHQELARLRARAAPVGEAREDAVAGWIDWDLAVCG